MACARAIEVVLLARWDPARPISLLGTALAVLDSLHGIARVDPVEATEEMIRCGAALVRKKWFENEAKTYQGKWEALARSAFEAMSATGDLTNPPEEKPWANYPYLQTISNESLRTGNVYTQER
jgi:hypothetical protein